MRSRASCFAVVCCLLPLSMSCGGPSDPRLSVEERGHGGISPAIEELRRRQHVRWISESDDSEVPEVETSRDDEQVFSESLVQFNDTTKMWEAVESGPEFLRVIFEECAIQNQQIASEVGMLGSCDDSQQYLRSVSCALNLALDLSHLTEPRDLEYDSISATLTVPPQSTETNAALQEWAVRYGSKVTEQVDGHLGLNITSFSDCDSTDPESGELYGQLVSTATTDVVYTIRDAARDGAESYMAIADAEAAKRNGAARQRDVRLHGAALLAGGRPGIVAHPHFVERIDDDAERRAVELIRESGISPAETRNESSSDPDITDTEYIALLQTRMEDLWERSFASTDEFLAYGRVEPTALAGARRYLAEEHQAFGRTRDTLLPDHLAGSSGVYAATIHPPSRLSVGSYVEQVTRMYYDGLGPAALSDPMPRLLAQNATTAVTWAWDLQLILGAALATPPEGLDHSSDFILAELQVGSGAAEVELSHGWEPTRAAVATSQAALQCATLGAIDGVTCDLDDHTGNDLFDVEESFNPETDATGNDFVGGPLYVLGRAEGNAARPGAYQVLASGYIPSVATGTNIFQYLISDPELMELADELVAPSLDGPSEPERSCSGLASNQRLPLEDELTDDGDAYESSWRHYLDLAFYASDKADALAEEVVAQAIDIDRTSEEALGELEDLCGATVSVDPLLTSTSETDPLAVLEDGAGVDGDVDDVIACLDTARVHDYMALGSSKVCIWDDGSGGDLCADSEMHGECPRVVDTSSECTAGSFDEQVLDGDKLLRLVEMDRSSGGDGTTNVTANTCKDFRAFRKALEDWDEAEAQSKLGKVRDARTFAPEVVRARAPAIRWEAHPLSGSTLYINEAPVVQTGTFASEGGSGGLCWGTGLEVELGCEDGGGAPIGSGLFCDDYDCTDAGGDRPELNARLARAAIVARWLGQDDFSGFRVPWWRGNRPNGRQFVADGEDRTASSWQQYTSSKDGETDYWCYGESGAPDSMWDYYDYYRGTSVVLDSEENHCNNTFRITRLTGKKAFGNNNPQKGTVEANHVRAGELLRQIDSAGVDELTVGGHHPMAPLYGMSVGISTLCPDCNGNQNGKKLSWIAGQGGRHVPERQVKQRGLRFYLDRDELSPTGGAPRLPPEPFLDALELLCEASLDEEDRAALPSGTGDELTLESRDDIPKVIRRFERLSSDVRQRSQTVVLRNVPEEVATVVRGSGDASALADLGGAYGVAVRDLRASLIDMRQIPRDMSKVVNDVARDMESLKSELDVQENNIELNRIRGLRDTLRSAERCALASIPTDTTDGYSGARAAITCAFSGAHIALAGRETGLREDSVEHEIDRILLGYEDKVSQHMRAIEGLAGELQESVERFDGALVELERIRSRGLRTLAGALFSGESASGVVLRSNVAMRRRYQITAKRYEDAKEDAIVMADLAKRSIEQRFAVRLAGMDEDMTLVDAPSKWAGDLCMLQGIDFRELRDPTAEGEEEPDFTNGYIGDYVTKLEQFVESYRLDYPFQSGADTAVISLRDDVLGVRATCDTPVNNLLHHSNQLGVPPDMGLDPETEETVVLTPGWEPFGCDECIHAVELDGDQGPAASRGAPLGQPSPYSVRPCTETGCGWVSGALWGQEVEVAPGELLRLSFYARPADVGSPGTAPEWVQVEEPVGETVHSWTTVAADDAFCEGYELCWPGSCSFDVSDCGDKPVGDRNGDGMISGVNGDDGDGWLRFWFYVRPTEPRVRVIVPPASEVEIAGVQLAEVNGAAPQRTSAPDMMALDSGDYKVDTPGDFAETSSTLTHPLPVCEDTDGEIFRTGEVWTYECVPVCLDGLGGCPDNYLEPLCYWETSFSVSLSEIEERKLFSQAGFALGNFNYRTDTLGVNFVGSGARTCEDAELPSTCYSAGFVPYTLVHEPPYPVRSHDGQSQEALVFRGRIEHARGLATERYLSNPVSSADQSQMDPYMQRQFRGRPLTGNYTLRVWDEPGVNFHGIDDVQLLLNYRFWTRFD